MRRHRSLVAFSHDHHHALVQARRLRSAGNGPEAVEVAAAFLRFFDVETARHFREEEELLFPLAVDFEEAHELVAQTLVEHQRLRARVMRLRQLVVAGEEVVEPMNELGVLLEAHIRREERQLFPLIERLVDEATLSGIPPARRDEAGAGGAERTATSTRGIASEELNATVLSWNAGTGPPEHVNEERDVLIAVLDGSASVKVGDTARELSRGEALIVARGELRKITAGEDGVSYLSVHRRRLPIQIQRSSSKD